MNEQAQALARQLRQAIQRSHEGYPLQVTFDPNQLVLLGQILDDAEARENESEIWRRVEALAKRVLAEPQGAPRCPQCNRTSAPPKDVGFVCVHPWHDREQRNRS